MPTTKPRVQVTLDPELYARLKAEAKRQRRSVAGLVVHIVADHMDDIEDLSPEVAELLSRSQAARAGYAAIKAAQ